MLFLCPVLLDLLTHSFCVTGLRLGTSGQVQSLDINTNAVLATWSIPGGGWSLSGTSVTAVSPSGIGQRKIRIIVTAGNKDSNIDKLFTYDRELSFVSLRVLSSLTFLLPAPVITGADRSGYWFGDAQPMLLTGINFGTTTGTAKLGTAASIRDCRSFPIADPSLMQTAR